MPVRSFDGVDDRVTLAIGSLGFAFGPGTIAAWVKRGVDDSVVTFPFYAGPTAGGSRYGIGLIATTGALRLDSGGANRTSPSITVTVADGWCLIAATKATGSVQPRYHKYKASTATWTHEDGTGTVLGNSGAPTTSATIGCSAAANFFEGDIGVVGVWNVVLSDAEVEALAQSETDWLAVTPVALWVLDQASTATPVVDEVGNADETALTGTTITADDVPWVAGSTHETASWQSSYVVKDRVTQTWGSSYTTRTRLGAAWASAFTASTREAAVWSSSYVLQARGSVSWASSWVTKARVSQTWQSSYGGSQRSTQTWGTSYIVRARALQVWESSYNVSTGIHVQQTWESSWTTHARETASWVSSYQVAMHLTQAWASLWAVHTRVGAEWRSGYTVEIPEPPTRYTLTIGVRSGRTIVASERTPTRTLEVT